MEPTEDSVIRGFGVSVCKSRVIRHTVSHVILLDPRFSNPNESGVLLNAKCQYVFGGTSNACFSSCKSNCFSTSSNQLFELGSSGLFTAVSDGEVIWTVAISLFKTKSTTAGVDDTYKYTAHLVINSKPKDYGIRFFASFQTDLTNPFSVKPDDTSYSLISPGQANSVRTQFSQEFQFQDNNQKVRLDLTYFVSTKPNSELTTLRGPKTNSDLGEPFATSVLAALLEKSSSSDITLEANGKKWHLHKCILSVRSPVFAAMFSSDMKEKTQDTIVYEDVDKDAFDIMIKYIYTNDLGDLEEDVAISLLFLSDRFDLPGLKEKCEMNLYSRMDTSNCLNFLLTAEKCNAKLLSAVAESTLLTNFRIVSKTEEWAEFVNTDFDRSVEIVRKV